MDPLTALSLAGSVVQFVHFGASLVTGTGKIYASGAGLSADSQRLEDVYRKLYEFSSTLQTDKTAAVGADPVAAIKFPNNVRSDTENMRLARTMFRTCLLQGDMISYIKGKLEESHEYFGELGEWLLKEALWGSINAKNPESKLRRSKLVQTLLDYGFNPNAPALGHSQTTIWSLFISIIANSLDPEISGLSNVLECGVLSQLMRHKADPNALIITRLVLVFSKSEAARKAEEFTALAWVAFALTAFQETLTMSLSRVSDTFIATLRRMLDSITDPDMLFLPIPPQNASPWQLLQKQIEACSSSDYRTASPQLLFMARVTVEMITHAKTASLPWHTVHLHFTKLFPASLLLPIEEALLNTGHGSLTSLDLRGSNRAKHPAVDEDEEEKRG